MRLLPGFLLAGFALFLWGTCAFAEDTAAPRTDAAPLQTESQKMARELLLGMARFVGRTQKFEVKLRSGYDVLQDNGQKIEFGERREVFVERPGKFRSVHRESDGREDVMLFDGENITVSDAGTGVYAKAPQPGDLDASITYFVRDLKMRLPIAPLFMSRFAEELERRVTAVDYVEQTDVLGEITHHLAGRTELVDFQIWIRDAEQPVPLRIVLSYRAEEGHPEFWMDFSDWNLKPRFGRKTFQFEAPKDSRQIVFLVQMLPAPGSATTATPQSSTEATP